MEGGDVRFRFTADTSGLQAAASQAEQSLANVGKTAETAGSKVSTALNRASVSTTAAASSASKAAKAFGPLGGVLARVSPEAGALSASIAALTSAGEGFASAGISMTGVLGTIAPIAATAGGGIALLMAVVNDYTAAKKEATRATEMFADALKPLDVALQEAEAEFALLTQAQAAGKEEFAEYQRVAAIHAGVSAKVTTATAAHREELKKLEESLGDVSGARTQEQIIAQGRIKVLRDEIAAMEAMGSRTAALKTQADGLNAALSEQEKTTKAVAKETETAAEMQARWAAAGQEAATSGNAAFAEQLAVIEAARAATAGLVDQIDALNDTEIEGIERAGEARDDELEAQMARNEALGIDNAELQEAIRENELRTLEEIGEVRNEEHEEELDRIAEEKAARSAAASKYLAAASSALSSIQTLADANLDAQLAGEDELTGAKRESALEAFNLQKGVAIASAAISTAQAVLKSFADLGPIAGAIAGVAVAAIGAVQIGIIASQQPSFHAGGLAPDEVNATLLGGEAVLNRQATARLGPQGVANLNAGGGAGVTGGVTIIRIGRKEAREIARTDIRANGIIPATARKISARGGRPAGLSGRGVLA